MMRTKHELIQCTKPLSSAVHHLLCPVLPNHPEWCKKAQNLAAGHSVKQKTMVVYRMPHSLVALNKMPYHLVTFSMILNLSAYDSQGHLRTCNVMFPY